MRNSTVTIQKTHKKWKLVQMVSFLLIILGIILTIVGLYYNNLMFLSLVVLFLGIFGLIVAKIGAYWSNG